jgi:hypothetical protein
MLCGLHGRFLRYSAYSWGDTFRLTSGELEYLCVANPADPKVKTRFRAK